MDGARHGAAAVARVFTQQPDRVAAAWRRVRYAQQKDGGSPQNLLDDVVEPFIRAVGGSLAGDKLSAWARTGGVLRLSVDRGPRALYDEFTALRRCLVDAMEVLGGGDSERSVVERSVDEAVDSAVALAQRMSDPSAAGPRVPFGGLVVECFDRIAEKTVPDARTPVPLGAEMH